MSNLLPNLLLFGRVLHGLGLEVSPGRMVDVLAALAEVNIVRKPDFYYTLRSFLVKRKEHLPLFDAAFEQFWRKPRGEWGEVSLADLLQFRPPPPAANVPLVVPPLPDLPTAAPPTDDEEVQEVIEVTQTFSTRELLRHKDFGELSAEELTNIKQLIAQLVWQLGQRRTRRQKIGHGRNLALRRSLRRNLRYGGEMLEWSYKEPKIKPRPLVILADVSGSMERYTRLLVHFFYSLTQGLAQPVEVFLFSTRLTRITRQLAHKNVDQALDEVGTAVHDWAGGTRIGEAIKSFNFDWSRRVLRGGAIVLLISDGWDRGDPAVLGKEIDRLHKLCHRLVWLNPLLGSQEYEPLTRGIVAALPHIDDFLPVHNLASLEELADHLRQLDGRRQGHGRSVLSLRGAAFSR
ncbi:MAG: VWA domain-containing protein [Chloroflexi bacterium]|nr:VWA domain-containing protein [Chloroflexota bacterium]